VYGDISAQFVEGVNYRTGMHAKRFIAAPSRTFPGAQALRGEGDKEPE
jgi:hypothetical protein